MEKNFELCYLSTLTLVLITTFARAIPTGTDVNDVPTKYSHVCDRSRFSTLGLDISHFAYCNRFLPFDVRAKDLVDRMTLAEKVQQLDDKATGVPRIGLPQYKWWSEALHGVSNVGHGTFFDQLVPGATSFPTVILTSASFNQSLWNTIGKVVSTEARAMYNLGRAGLTFWSPTINVARDPRWGRITETPGEDPYVVGTYAVNYVRGLQDIKGFDIATRDPNSRPLKVSACCKHYAGYDVDNWHGVDRYHFDARVTEQDKIETFLRPFEMCVKEGDVSSVMCSYNRLNGIPTCADPVLLKGTLRDAWHLNGYIVADCDSIEVIVNDHKWLNDTGEDATAQTLKAGLDLDCGNFYGKYLQNAVIQGKVMESDIDKSLRYLYVVLMRLGFFDGNPLFASLGKKDVCSEQHIELAAEAAREGIVLLKNDNETLPLDSTKFKSLAVIGPHANATKAMIGNYAGIPCRYVSPLDGFSKVSQVQYVKGCGDVACKSNSSFASAIQAAKNNDATILFIGLDLSVEAESLDRESLILPGLQTQLVNQVAEASKGPVILVIMSAGGIDISFAKNNKKIKSILWAGYPGEEGGHAITDVVFGIYNPGGRLPITWHETNYVEKIPLTSMSLRPIDSLGYPGRTYRFFNGSTVYPFGYGLSYTKFQYKLLSKETSLNIRLSPHQLCRDLNYTNAASMKSNCLAVVVDDLTCKNQFSFLVNVQNVGSRDGSEVVLVYSKPPEGIIGTHLKQVIGFERVHVPTKSNRMVKFAFNVCKSLNIVDNAGNKLLPSGRHTIMLGDDVQSVGINISFI